MVAAAGAVVAGPCTTRCLAEDTTLMLFAYAKNEQADLTNEQRKTALAIIKEITDD